MKFKMINDRAARVQVKGDILEQIVQPNDKAHGGSPTVSRNGCWIRTDPGGWVTISGFGPDEDKAQSDLTLDLMALREAIQEHQDKDAHPDLKD